MAVVIVAWVAATPLTLRHPRTVQRVGYVAALAVIGRCEAVRVRDGSALLAGEA